MPVSLAIHCAPSSKPPPNALPRKPPANLALNLHGRTRSLPSKPNRRYGFLNGKEHSDNPPPASIHTTFTFDHENTDNRSTAHRHRSVEEARRTHSQSC